MEDTELVRKMISGDMDAFDELMEKYRSPALRAAYLISGNLSDSEDIVQETFVACYLNRKRLKNPEAFKSWFYRMLSRIAWRICKKAGRETPTEEIVPQDAAAPGELLGSLVRKEEETLIWETVKTLPVKQRTVIVLYYYNQMSIKEIAAACGCLEGTVKSRLFHGKARLKAALTGKMEEGGTTWTILS